MTLVRPAGPVSQNLRPRLLKVAAISTCLLMVLFAACQPQGVTGGVADSSEVKYLAEVVKEWPHDNTAFTQGLIFYQGTLWESTGGYGVSTLRKVDLETGQVLQRFDVPAEFFAEGMTIFQNRLYQLTWQTSKGFIYDPTTFQPQGEFQYSGEGWGLTHSDQDLIMSNGTNRIRFFDPVTFETRRVIEVSSGKGPVKRLNELEYINGEIYANIWHSDQIVRIDPQSGKVLAWIDLEGLGPPKGDNSDQVLNGIAYDRERDRLFVTGKLWPKLFEIRIVRKQPTSP